MRDRDRQTTDSVDRPRPGVGIIIWFFVLFIILALFWRTIGQEDSPLVPYSLFRDQVRAGNVEVVIATGQELEGIFINPVEIETNDRSREVNSFITYVPAFGDELVPLLEEFAVPLETNPEPNAGWWLLILNLLPFLLLLAIFFFVFSRIKSSQGQGIFSMGQSRARLYNRERALTTFNDVAGTEGAKEELRETVLYLKDPRRFKRLGGKTPKGILLIGPPGTGKTLLARAVAGEAGVPFFSTSGSDFMEMFVGVGASRVRKMFEEAKKTAPSIVFIDELDSIGRRRGTGIGGGHDEREQTLNQLLTEMDGFEPNQSVIIIAATNRPDVLDPALLRPGRFDRQVTVDLPTQRSRLAILKVHARGKSFSDDIDFEKVARATPSFSGADLENLLNEAALSATRQNKATIEPSDIADARDRILLGRRREGLNLSPEDINLLAYHEAGHAVVSAFLPFTDPIEKVTIIPRGNAMGVTQHLPDEEKYIHRIETLKNSLVVMMGGRAAEQFTFGSASSGAANDLKQATGLARKMVMELGMSSKLGTLSFGGNNEQVFLGEQMAQRREHSEATQQLIDQEIKKLVDEAFETALSMLQHYKEELDALAEKLILEEEVSGDDMLALLGITGKKDKELYREREAAPVTH